MATAAYIEVLSMEKELLEASIAKAREKSIRAMRAGQWLLHASLSAEVSQLNQKLFAVLGKISAASYGEDAEGRPLGPTKKRVRRKSPKPLHCEAIA